MQPEYKEKLLECGFEMDKTMARFMGNEELYEKFLNRFTEDESMEKLKICYEEGDLEEAFFAAHTLKGVAANLGLKPLLEPLEQLVEKLRAKEKDDEAKAYFEKTMEKYREVIEIIQMG